MSELNRIKGIVLSLIKTQPELKRAITKVINAIDTDLDVGGYVSSSDTDLALQELDEALINYDESINNPPMDESDLTIQTTKRKDFSPNPELEDSDN